MLWAAVTASGIGFLLGLLFRVRALIAASLALVVLSSAVALFRQQAVLASLALTYAFLAALQGGYLVGVAVSCAWPRFKRRRQKDLGVGRSSKAKFRYRWHVMRAALRFPNHSHKEGNCEEHVDDGDPGKDDEEHLRDAIKEIEGKTGNERGHALTPR